MAKKKIEALVIKVPALKIHTIDMTIVGTSEPGDSPRLVTHNWDKKAQGELENARVFGDKGDPKVKKLREPEREFLACLYPMNGKLVTNPKKIPPCGFPTRGIKAAAVRAATDCGNNMTDVRRAFHIDGVLAVIKSKKPKMRKDMVRLGGQSRPIDIRWRAEFLDWSIKFKVRFNANVISAERIVSLFNTAGFGVGIGEDRGEKGGQWGMFKVV